MSSILSQRLVLNLRGYDAKSDTIIILETTQDRGAIGAFHAPKSIERGEGFEWTSRVITVDGQSIVDDDLEQKLQFRKTDFRCVGLKTTVYRRVFIHLSALL